MSGKSDSFHSFYVKNDQRVLLGGHLEFLSLKIQMTIYCIIT